MRSPQPTDIDAGARDADHGRLAASAATNGLAFMPAATLPWLTARLVEDWGFGDAQAGLIGTLQLACLAMTAIGLGVIVDRLPRRRIALVAGAVIFTASAALAWSSFSVPQTVALIAIIGIASGACSAVANSWLAAAREPGKQIANMWMFLVIWQALLWFITPHVVEAWRISGLFAVVAANAVPLTAVIFLARVAQPAGPPPPTASATMSRQSLTLWLVLAVSCTFAFWLRDSLVWSLAERRASALGVSASAMSFCLSAGAVLGFLGPLAARVVGVRYGRLAIVLFALLLVGGVITSIAAANSAVTYVLAFLLWSGTSLFAWTYIFELSALVDSSGRVAAICGGTVFGASALGPVLGGLLLERFPPGALVGATAILTLMTFATAAPLVSHVQKTSVGAA